MPAQLGVRDRGPQSRAGGVTQDGSGAGALRCHGQASETALSLAWVTGTRRPSPASKGAAAITAGDS
ncbi:MAG: hypothetical protein ACRDJU_09290 [Actinomycetota bacterium]